MTLLTTIVNGAPAKDTRETLNFMRLTAALNRVFGQMHRAAVNNAIDLPNYGSGPTAGLAAPTLNWLTATAALTAKPQALRYNGAQGTSFASYRGGTLYQVSGASFGVQAVTSTAYTGPGGAARIAVGWALEFVTDDAAPCIEVNYNNGSQWRLLVDGQFLAGSTVNSVVIGDRAPSFMPNVNSGGAQALQITFPGRSSKGRHIRFEFELGASIRGVLVGVDSSVWAPQPVDFTRLAFITDSYGAIPTENGNPNSYAHDNVSGLMGKFLGAHDTVQLGVAGTGFATDSALGKNYADDVRIADLAAAHAQPGGVHGLIAFGSINDRDKTDAAVSAGVDSFLTKARAALGPAVPIVLTGVAPGAQGVSTVLSKETTIAARVAAFADPLVGFAPFSSRTVPPITGTGNIQTAKGDGSADRYIRADNIHPTFGTLPGTGGIEIDARVRSEGFRSAITAMRSR